MADIQAIVFDLDDTLFSERSYAFSGFEAVAESYQEVLGNPVATVIRMKDLFNSDLRRRIFNEVLLENNLPDEPETVDGMIETYRNHHPKISLHLDAVTALTDFRSKYRLGIITDGPAVVQRAKLSVLHLEDLVDEIIVTDELGEGCAKPNPGAFELMARRLGVDHKSCVYVGDNPSKDFVSPNKLGWLSVQINRPDGIYRDAVTPIDGKPKHIIDTLDALPLLLMSIK